MIIDAGLSLCHVRLRRHFDRARSASQLKSKDQVNQLDRDFNHHVETGFQLATFQGPLCAEPVEGIAYFLESLEIDRRDRGTNFRYIKTDNLPPLTPTLHRPK